MSFVGGAHQANGDPIGILDDCVARSPERIVGRLNAEMTLAGQSSVQLIPRRSDPTV